MKIATWNVNSLNVRLPQVLQWLATYQPDVLALQELKLDQDKFPVDAITETGFHVAWYGQKTYNGVAIIAKTMPQDVVCGLAGFADEQRRVVAATVNGVRVVNAYCVNGEAVGSEKFDYKRRWFAALRDAVKAELVAHEQLVLLGDFNIAPADLDVYDPKRWHEKILCSGEERSWFQALLDLGLHDALRQMNAHEALFTWWDYRMNGFKRDLGLRIDHLLLSVPLMTSAVDYGIDRDARAAERPSDHAPVWVQLRV